MLVMFSNWLIACHHLQSFFTILYVHRTRGRKGQYSHMRTIVKSMRSFMSAPVGVFIVLFATIVSFIVGCCYLLGNIWLSKATHIYIIHTVHTGEIDIQIRIRIYMNISICSCYIIYAKFSNQWFVVAEVAEIKQEMIYLLLLVILILLPLCEHIPFFYFFNVIPSGYSALH